MQYTDKQIEEAVKKTVVQKPMATFVDLTRLIMRMVRAELANRVQVHLEGAHQVTRIRSLNPLPEFWKEPEEAPERENPPNGWQTIHTAPLLKYVFVLGPCGQIDVVLKGYNEWALRAGGFLDYKPTHWMPIPQLPEDKNG